MKRREFIALIGGTAALPLTARAQQPAMPVIGFMHAGSPGPSAEQVESFLKGLAESGLTVGQNVASNTIGRRAATIACRRSRPTW